MSPSDVFVFSSVLVLATLLFWVIYTTEMTWIDPGPIRAIEIAGALALLFAGAWLEKGILLQALVFGTMAGIILPLVADPYLVQRTLRYQKSYLRIWKTPLWMVTLWIILLTQLCYLWLRLEGLPTFFKYGVFIFTGGAHIFFFEWVVGNHTDWLKRVNCIRLWGIGNYALWAEVILILTLPVLVSFGGWEGLLWVYALRGVAFGAIIAMYFCIGAMFEYAASNDACEEPRYPT